MSVQDLISSQKRRDGQIAEGVYIAMEYRGDELIRLYMGTKESGPMLQYDSDGRCRYTGEELTEEEEDEQRERFSGGCWTPIYSRGDYKRNYSHGGHWSGHTKNLHPSIATTWSGKQEHRGNIATDLIVLPDGGGLVELPYGVRGGDIKKTDIDCSPGWVIWYESAEKAMGARLTEEEMVEARLSIQSKSHLVPNEKESAGKLREVINAFEL